MLNEASLGTHLGHIINTASFEWRLDESRLFLIHHTKGEQKCIHYRVGSNTHCISSSTLAVPIRQHYVCTVRQLSTTFSITVENKIENEVPMHTVQDYFLDVMFNKFMKYLEYLPKVHHLQGTTYSKIVKRDIDLKIEIEYVRSVSPVTIFFEKVLAHLDDTSEFVYKDAEQEVRQNIDMDESAKAFLNDPPPHILEPITRPGFFPSQKTYYI